MRIEAHLPHATLARLIRELAPIRLHMTPPEENSRWLELSEPTLIQPVPERGLRIKSSGRARFDVAGVPIKVRIKELSLVLEPEVVNEPGQKPRLAFGIDLERGDLAGVPTLLEKVLVKRINLALSTSNTKLVWNFGETLTSRFELPDRLEPLDAISIEGTGGDVRVDAETIHFAFEIEPHIERKGELPDRDQDDDALDADDREPATQEALERLVAVSAET